MKVSEFFKSIQGEGRHVGVPMMFIRLSGCNLKCSYCDSKYHVEGKDYTIHEMVGIINKSKVGIVCFTGGEPLLQRDEMKEVIEKIQSRFSIHIETNGDLLNDSDLKNFNYISVSPKSPITAERIQMKIYGLWIPDKFDIKVVTDLETVGMDMLQYATMLMPLTTYDTEKDKEIQKRVWTYCVNHDLRYSPRIQVDVWGKDRGI